MIWILLLLTVLWFAFLLFMIRRHKRQMAATQAAFDKCMADLKTALEATLKDLK